VCVCVCACVCLALANKDIIKFNSFGLIRAEPK